MDWYQTVFELIDMRSFSNLWFWIALATVWSTASHYVLGVPFDMVGRAARNEGQDQADLEEMVRIRVRRILYIVRTSGLWLVGLVSLVLTSLVTLGFVYGIEFAQALSLIAIPMTGVGLLTIRSAEVIAGRGLDGDDLRRRMTRHRVIVQVIGMIAIFVTALWGMYQNMNVGPLG